MVKNNYLHIHLFLASSAEKVNGFWAPWSPWSSCSGSCDINGKEQRQRECIDPQNGGEACIGTKTTETRDCGFESCPSRMYFITKIIIFLIFDFNLMLHILATVVPHSSPSSQFFFF